jgi:purine-binding chemotaxis protein CheW
MPQFCTFYLDKLFFGVEVERVQEVIRYQEMTPVPLAPRAIRGLINLRGQIVTAIDLRRRLDLPELSGDRLPMNIVIRGEEGPISLLVDKIAEVIDPTDKVLEPAPATLSGPSRELIRGACQFPGRLLLVLDLDKTLMVK